jgi:DNA recombination protein RmuC
VAHLWRQEAQTENAQLIAKQGAELYDKFVGFVTDLQSLGDRLKQANDEYQDAMTKLSSGKGNLIRRSERLKALGVTPSKSLPASLTKRSEAEED